MISTPMRCVWAAVLSLAGAGAMAQTMFPVQDTTCGSTSSVDELNYGVYELPGNDRAYPVQSVNPYIYTITLTPEGADHYPIILAICDAPPGPQALCRAITSSEGSSVSMTMSFYPSPGTQWILVDSPFQCSSFRITLSGPIGG